MKLEEKECDDALWILEDFDEDIEQEMMLTDEERKDKSLKETFLEIKNKVTKFFNSDSNTEITEKKNEPKGPTDDDQNNDNGEK